MNATRTVPAGFALPFISASTSVDQTCCRSSCHAPLISSTAVITRIRTRSIRASRTDKRSSTSSGGTPTPLASPAGTSSTLSSMAFRLVRLRLAQPVALDLVVQRRPVDIQNARRPRQVPARLLQDPLDVRPLDVVQPLPSVISCAGAPRRVWNGKSAGVSSFAGRSPSPARSRSPVRARCPATRRPSAGPARWPTVAVDGRFIWPPACSGSAPPAAECPRAARAAAAARCRTRAAGSTGPAGRPLLHQSLQVLVGGRDRAEIHLDRLVSPTRTISFSCSTRSRSVCVFRLMSLISSRNTVPPSATSNLPFLRYCAPVNAPLSWPNSSLSSSVSVSAPQWIATMGM